jgi:hypothetical protein
VGRDGVDGLVEEASREIDEVDLVRVEELDVVLETTGIPEEEVVALELEPALALALASFRNLFGFPSSH